MLRMTINANSIVIHTAGWTLEVQYSTTIPAATNSAGTKMAYAYLDISQGLWPYVLCPKDCKPIVPTARKRQTGFEKAIDVEWHACTGDRQILSNAISDSFHLNIQRVDLPSSSRPETS